MNQMIEISESELIGFGYLIYGFTLLIVGIICLSLAFYLISYLIKNYIENRKKELGRCK